ncbi:MAG: tRNA 5-hydroxyuridine modification protein YegQ [Burkholderiales bacterium]|jgi:putative protease|nr:tRNA 5-hydroxyuridine modification protein YegQ [Burkholderiales bacterium]
MNRPELLSPAGSLKSLRYAIAYGADAVYAGLPRYSLRVRNNEFRNTAALAEGIAAAHTAGKAFYLAVNVMPHNRKVETFLDDLTPVVALKPDALIMADPGLIMLVRERWPDMPIHLSVQANTVNQASVRFWQRQGIARIILSRELSLDEIADIRQHCPDIELEVFVHGALCIAYSGRCLLSGYFNHRDSNQGACTNACRWRYRLAPGIETAEGTLLPTVRGKGKNESPPLHILPSPACGRGVGGEGENNLPPLQGEGWGGDGASTSPYLLEETGRRRNEWMEISEDEHGTYLMNSRDLRAIRHIRRLIETGIDCLKIEGRTKSHYYAARTAQIYKQAINDAMAGREFNPDLLKQLDGLANRGYTEGFFDRHAPDTTQNYTDGGSSNFTQQFVAEVIDHDPETGLSTLDVKNHFAVRDTLEIIAPKGNRTVLLSALWDLDGNPITVAPGSGYVVKAEIGKTDSTTLIASHQIP